MSEADDSESMFPTRVGDLLRTARQQQGLSLEEIAARTRVPSRHLAMIENGDLSRLPAAPYSVGFIKAYARVVGLSEADLSRDFREELAVAGGDGVASMAYAPDDPSRVAPRALAWTAAIIAVLFVLGYVVWRHSVDGDYDSRAQLAAGTAPESAPPPTDVAPPPSTGPREQVAPSPIAPSPIPGAAPTTPTTPTGPVALTARAPVWVRVYDGQDNTTLFMGQLAAGQRYEIPPGAIDPMIRTGRAEFLTVTVGTVEAPPLGPPSTILHDVSLRPAVLLGQAPARPARDSAAAARRARRTAPASAADGNQSAPADEDLTIPALPPSGEPALTH